MIISTVHVFHEQQATKQHHNNSQPETSIIRPMLSVDDILKLNTDGSSRGNPGPSSYGGLIRDSKGRWLCGYMGKMKGRSYTALEAEVFSIYKGLCLIKEKNLANLLIETDCETVLRLRACFMADFDPLKRIMEDIEKMMIERRCAFMHTRRYGNHCADQLAKLGGRQSEEYAVLEQPPDLLIPYLIRDVEMKKFC